MSVAWGAGLATVNLVQKIAPGGLIPSRIGGPGLSLAGGRAGHSSAVVRWASRAAAGSGVLVQAIRCRSAGHSLHVGTQSGFPRESPCTRRPIARLGGAYRSETTKKEGHTLGLTMCSGLLKNVLEMTLHCAEGNTEVLRRVSEVLSLRKKAGQHRFPLRQPVEAGKPLLQPIDSALWVGDEDRRHGTVAPTVQFVSRQRTCQK